MVPSLVLNALTHHLLESPVSVSTVIHVLRWVSITIVIQTEKDKNRHPCYNIQ